MKTAAALLVAFLGFAVSTKVTYNNYKVYNINAETEHQKEYLKFLDDNSNFDFWAPVNNVGAPVVVMVKPEVQKGFEDYLQNNNFTFNVQIDNVQDTIVAEEIQRRLRKPTASGRISFDNYLTLFEIQEFLATIANSYPDIARLETIGYSYEGRPITLLRINTGGNNKPQIYIEGGIHAREWISPAVIVYLIEQLVNPANRELITHVNWIIVPSINPDGYQYTWDRERLWRKTRRPGTLCYGVDGNRNFDFHWLESGASTNQCSETYAGSAGFSEPETRVLRDSVLKESNVELFLSVHSYGQYLLYSWGWTSALPNNYIELDGLAKNVDNAIAAVAGTRYKIGSSTNVLYAAAGNSPDWAKGVAGIPLTYTIELPGGGSYGFDLPASRLLPVAVETFEGFKVFGEYVANKYKK